MCQCGQTTPSVNPDQDHSAALMAWMVAEADPESPPQDARGTVLEQALIWSGSPPGLAALPQPLPPRERTEHEKSFNQKLLLDWGREGAKQGAEDAVVETEQEATFSHSPPAPEVISAPLAERCWAQPVKQQSQGRASSQGQPTALLNSQDCGKGYEVYNTHFKAFGTCQPGAAWRLQQGEA